LEAVGAVLLWRPSVCANVQFAPQLKRDSLGSNMRSIATTVFLITICACGRKSAQQRSVDTVMVFEPAPNLRLDTAHERLLRDSLLVALAPYYKGRMSVEDAAKILVDYRMHGGPPPHIAMDEQLLAAVYRETEKRKP